MKQFGWQVVGCSMPAMQRQEKHGHQELIAALMGQQAGKRTKRPVDKKALGQKGLRTKRPGTGRPAFLTPLGHEG